MVSQGSSSNDPNDLIIPTLNTLASRDDIHVVATLVKSDNLDHYKPPSNTFIAKFIPFDQLFEHVDIVVSKGGYGMIQVALSRGVPMVLAGLTEDKPEANMGTAATGAAINLNTNTATAE